MAGRPCNRLQTRVGKPARPRVRRSPLPRRSPASFGGRAETPRLAALRHSCPVSYMSPRNRAPKSANFSILNSLSTLPEPPLPHPLGCLANRPENRGEESPAGHSPDHPPDNRENHRDDSPADYREDNLPESVEDNLDRSLDSRSADYSADCLENHPESNLGDNPEDNLEDNGENDLPDDSADRSSRSWADSCSNSYPSTSLRPRAGVRTPDESANRQSRQARVRPRSCHWRRRHESSPVLRQPCSSDEGWRDKGTEG